MTKQEYIEKVKQALKGIDEQDRTEAIEYLEEYFMDAKENEQEVINNLGSPEKYAATIKADLIVELPRQKETYLKKCWTIVLGILSLPLAIPMMVLIFAMLVVVLSLTFSLIVSLLALIMSGFFWLFTLFTADFFSIGSVLLTTGMIILSACLLYILAVYVFPWMTSQLAKLYQKLKNRR